MQVYVQQVGKRYGKASSRPAAGDEWMISVPAPIQKLLSFGHLGLHRLKSMISCHAAAQEGESISFSSFERPGHLYV